MNTYYEVLGLEPGASQTDIKKAYFKMIRKHSPESDPEQFQQIREAYEQLKNMQNAPQGPEFPPLSGPQAQIMMKQIEKYRRAGNSIMFRDACEEAWRLFPDDIQFLYLLITAQQQCGNTGKAVKNAELLASKDPQNPWFQRELAFSYIKRGFTKKAYQACKKTYELGIRDMDFILMYSLECNTYGKYDRGVQLLLEVIRQEKRWAKEEIPELVNAYMGLLKMNCQAEETHFPEIMERLGQMLQQYGLYMAEYMHELAMMMSFIGADRRIGAEECQKVEQALDVMHKACRGDAEAGELIEEAREEFYYQRVVGDARLGDTMKQCCEAQLALDKWNSSLGKFLLIDAELCMIEEREEILGQAEILRRDYPHYYEKIQDFLAKLESQKNLADLKARLQKTYQRMEPDFADFGEGCYYEKYPHEQKKMQGTVIYDGYNFEPYVRDGKKIGRNDPCPCGSGKKYKHCCMKK